MKLKGESGGKRRKRKRRNNENKSEITKGNGNPATTGAGQRASITSPGLYLPSGIFLSRF